MLIGKSRRLLSWTSAALAAWLTLVGCDVPGNESPAPSQAPTAGAAVPVPVRVVIVTMFERGADEGDEPGEFQFWKERRNLDQRFAFPHSHHDLYYNADSQILGMVTGVGTAKSATATMALGLDPRFDLRQAYWLVAGIAGIDPEDASVGSAVWSAYLVDGDLGYEIDAREIPEDWDFGFFARRTRFPFDP
ncbi:MAG: purine nucleoside permease, partial [Gammaproteobacteria bacterium]|nr:purine nucleoside permease [Gammaproteobacteria bacterium]